MTWPRSGGSVTRRSCGSGTTRGPRSSEFLDYDVEIRTVLCSTNAIESLNARCRRAVKARGHFPDELAALKCFYLVTRSLDPTGAGRARWTMRWKPALNAFARRRARWSSICSLARAGHPRRARRSSRPWPRKTQDGCDDGDPEYVLARSVLLDALQALGPHLDAVILVGAQAVYLQTGDVELIVVPTTTDADLAIFPAKLLDEPPLEDALRAAGFELAAKPGCVAWALRRRSRPHGSRGPEWVRLRYHFDMAFVVKLSPDDTEALRAQAVREHRSMHEVAVLAIQARIAADRRAAVLDQLFDQAGDEDAELLARLAK